MRWIWALALCTAMGLAQEESTPKQRVKAVKDLAKGGSPAIQKIAPYLDDVDVDVRQEATRAIVDIGTQRSLDPLLKALKDEDSEVKIRAIEGLANFYLPGYVQTGLTSQIKHAGSMVGLRFADNYPPMIDADVRVRPEILESLAGIVGSANAMPVRASAARALGSLRGNNGVPQLTEALRSKDDQLIYESLIALQKIGDRSAGPRVIFLLRDLNEKVQQAALETVGLLRTQEALPDLRRLIERTDNKKTRRAAVQSLAMIPDPGNRKILEPYLSDKDDVLRAAAAEGMGRIGGADDVQRLSGLFDSEKKQAPRLAFAFATVASGKTDVQEFSPLQYLINTLNSKAWKGVSYAYIEELARKPEVREKLVPMLSAGTRDERTSLALALGKTGAPEVIPALEALTKDSDASVAQEGTRALRIARARAGR